MTSSLSASFAQALFIGVSIAAPVGPIGLLTIQRSLDHGRRAGLATGMGAAVADAFYGALGAYGVSSVIALMAQARVPLGAGGAAFLLWMAWRLWTAPLASRAAMADVTGSLGRYFAGTLVLTLSNPTTIFSFMAVFGALSAQGSQAPPWLLVLGVFLGSALWWLLLSAVVGRLGARFDASWRLGVQRGSALVLAAFALWQIGELSALVSI